MTYSCRPLYKDKQRQDDQLEPTYNISVPIQDVALKTYQEQWTIDGWRERVREIRVGGAKWWWWNWLNVFFFLNKYFQKTFVIYFLSIHLLTGCRNKRTFELLSHNIFVFIWRKNGQIFTDEYQSQIQSILKCKHNCLSQIPEFAELIYKN